MCVYMNIVCVEMSRGHPGVLLVRQQWPYTAQGAPSRVHQTVHLCAPFSCLTAPISAPLLHLAAPYRTMQHPDHCCLRAPSSPSPPSMHQDAPSAAPKCPYNITRCIVKATCGRILGAGIGAAKVRAQHVPKLRAASSNTHHAAPFAHPLAREWCVIHQHWCSFTGVGRMLANSPFSECLSVFTLSMHASGNSTKPPAHVC